MSKVTFSLFNLDNYDNKPTKSDRFIPSRANLSNIDLESPRRL